MYTWKQVPGFPNYWVSNTGLVCNVQAEMLCNPYTDKKGGHMLKLLGQRGISWVMLPKLVASCFVPNEDLRLTHVVHINGQRLDNRAENLRWAHRSELTQELLDTTSKIVRGPRPHCPFHLSPEDVQAIREGAAVGVSMFVLAREFGCSRTSIANILRGDTHRNDRPWDDLPNVA